jgi:hypothetical protein
VNDAWFGARITGRDGTFSDPIERARNAISPYATVSVRTTS